MTDRPARSLLGATWLVCALALASSAQTGPQNSPTSAPQNSNAAASPSPSASTRGGKLVLKDGSFQLVREYKVEGDRVSYYSLDTHQWEEMPASLVDWDATKKAAGEQAHKDAALVNAVEAREKETRAQLVDADASIQVADGLFLPAAPGLYAFDGKAISVVGQAQIRSSVSKKRLMEQVMVPVPIVPSRQDVTIAGPSAKLRLKNGQPEFYMRPADGREPDIDLIRAKVQGQSRLVEHIDQLMGQNTEKRESMEMQRWQIAQGVYRFTLAKPLPPGEYVIAERVGDQSTALYVWDFGVEKK